MRGELSDNQIEGAKGAAAPKELPDNLRLKMSDKTTTLQSMIYLVEEFFGRGACGSCVRPALAVTAFFTKTKGNTHSRIGHTRKSSLRSFMCVRNKTRQTHANCSA